MFVKVVKNNAYFKRFQVRFRRRREGKTDYYQRRRLVTQRKNKYNTAKYRFVVRRTNSKIVCQVVYTTIDGDFVKAQAQSTELKKYGLTAGLTNYSASYATGLLCARRLLRGLDKENAKLEGWTSLADKFNLVPETTGEYIDIEKTAEKKDLGNPFVAFLDLGLFRSTNGARVFAAMKGAVDGGIHIPHSDSIFPKFKEPTKEDKGKGKTKEVKKDQSKTPFRDRLFGTHVQTYMDLLLAKKDDKASFKKQFSRWEKNLTEAKVKTVPELYKKVFAEIRKNPDRPAAKKNEQKKVVRDSKDVNIVINGKHKYRRDVRLKNNQRKERVANKIKEYIKKRQEQVTNKK